VLGEHDRLEEAAQMRQQCGLRGGGRRRDQALSS
jgi:hypothetical protein